MDHIVWIKEGGRWRILSCYATRKEAMDCIRSNRADGEVVRYAVRGGDLDREIREGVHRS